MGHDKSKIRGQRVTHGWKSSQGNFSHDWTNSVLKQMKEIVENSEFHQ
jgi:hypothetical protein